MRASLLVHACLCLYLFFDDVMGVCGCPITNGTTILC